MEKHHYGGNFQMGITARINHVRNIRPKNTMMKLIYMKTNWLIVSLWILDKLVLLGLFLWAK